MVDIQTISVLLASASVIAGVVYYALQFRHQTRQRKTELIMNLYSKFSSQEMQEIWVKFNERRREDYDTYFKKYGYVEYNVIVMTFEELGILLQNGLVEIKMIEAMLHPIILNAWEKVKPLMEEMRRRDKTPQLGGAFEYLYNEVKKREQQLQ